jgi:hypothetical protein
MITKEQVIVKEHKRKRLKQDLKIITLYLNIQRMILLFSLACSIFYKY